ncbi:Ig-like domain-containing protein [Engelhardtia mirabilis]|uniref:SbsA Ig-like domain-containing protein n=1 Tax=Engelhardtia mirabilis TaxID=2528011 RepID=A0A518BP86_9BACT|nr:hypothetical protein Pla133_38920 [Planctomycetes bacterium Pla133]QDV03116.1 hypothetical protein Pla86_38910 [Planctomycetes bacterium Pla86]
MRQATPPFRAETTGTCLRTDVHPAEASGSRAGGVASSLRGAVAALGLVAMAACGGSSSSGGSVSQGQLGSTAIKPGQSSVLNGGGYIVTDNQSGTAVDFRLVGMAWGRLVDVYDTVPTSSDYTSNPLDTDNYESRLIYPDFVIGQAVDTAFESGELKWEFSTNPVNGQPRLRISADAETQKSLFSLRIGEATSGLQPVDPKGVGPTELPPFSVVARNAALVLTFDDLLADSSIGANSTVDVLVGDPPVTPFDARVLTDSNYGGVSAVDGTFRSSRIVIDFTVTADELVTVGQVVEVNGVGLPTSENTVQPNLAIRIPTKVVPGVGQFAVLTNPGGGTLNLNESGPVDFSTPTLDVAWTLRAGNATDENNGFLVDNIAPRVVGIQPAMITAASDDPTGVAGIDLVLSLEFEVTDCALNPQPGDVIQVSSILSYEVKQAATVVGSTAINVPVRIFPDFESVSASELAGVDVQFLSPWRESLGQSKAPCFVRFSPSAGLPPAFQVSPEADVIVRFSEPIDPSSARPFDTFYIARSALTDAQLSSAAGGLFPADTNDLVLGTIGQSSDGRELRFTPSVPFTHAASALETYYLNLFSDSAESKGLIDLGGNTLADALPRVPFTMDPAAAAQDTGSWVLRFNFAEEDGVGGPEIRGQYLFDETKGQIRPRPVQRFSAVIDRNTEPVVGGMVPNITALETPLSAQGSKSHLIWRYMDVGFDISQKDDLFYNLDIEGIALSPFGGAVVSTVYDEFEMRLGHAANVPDEFLIVLPPPIPAFPTSGFGTSDPFDSNFLSDPKGGPFVVHPRELGFAISSSDVVAASTGMPVLQMPWNDGLSESDKTFFTWRDTAVQTFGNVDDSGALLGGGVPTFQEAAILGLLIPPGDVWGPGIPDTGPINPIGVPSPGLPLLMEYRCYPTESISLNAFDMSMAVAVAPVPHFRAFSTGGTNTTGQVVIKDPDLQSDPTGGFDTTAGNEGQPTIARDDMFYMGQMDIVIRTSRVYTILMDAEQQPTFALGTKPYVYEAMVMRPSPSEQPVGTSVIPAWRGQNIVSLNAHPAMIDGTQMDVFGEPEMGPLGDPMGTPLNNPFPWSDPTWHDSLSDMNGLRFVQSRLTFIGNTKSGVTASLDSYGLAFSR